MNLLSTNKLGALSLIAGPTLAFIMFLIQPGGILIDTVPGSDSTGLIEVWRANEIFVKITSGLIIVGLMLMTFGVYEVHVAHRGNPGDGLNMGGLAFMSLGVVAWMMAHSLTVTLSSPFAAEEAWSATYLVRTSLLLSGGAAVGLGVLLFALSVIIDPRPKGTALKILTWLAALAGLVGLLGWLTAIFNSDSMDAATSIARGMYIVYVAWLVTLGVRLAREEETEE